MTREQRARATLEQKQRVIERVTAWQKANPEKTREYKRRWLERNRERRLAQNANWREANQERMREIRRRWAAAHPEYGREWRQKNKDKVNAYSHNRRAKYNGSYLGRDIERMLKEQKYKCAWCQTDISDSYEVEHVMPIALGGSNDPSNLQLACRRCNTRKGSKHPMDYIDYILENGI